MKVLWLAAGHLSLALGVVGIFLPLLPTTPFLLLASICYSKGSSRFEAWLLAHPRLGPLVVDWRQDGVIRLRAKIVATGLILASAGIPFFAIPIPVWGKVGMILTIVAVLGFIWSRPSRRSSESETSRM